MDDSSINIYGSLTNPKELRNNSSVNFHDMIFCYILRYDKNCSTFDKPNCTQIHCIMHKYQIMFCYHLPKGSTLVCECPTKITIYIFWLGAYFICRLYRCLIYHQIGTFWIGTSRYYFHPMKYNFLHTLVDLFLLCDST